MALQRCTIHSRMLPGVLCGAVQELCKCLSPVLESGNQFEFKMWDVVRKDVVAPAPALLRPEWKNQSVYLPLVSKLLQSQKRLHKQKILPLCQEEKTSTPWVYPFLGQTNLAHPLEEADQPVSIPLGFQLYITFFGSLQWTVSHYLVMREV